MNKYRNIKYEMHGRNFVKLTNLFVIDAMTNQYEKVYPNGIRFISVPECYKDNPTVFAKRCIDRMYEHREYFTKLETKKLMGDYKSRTGYTIEKMKETR